MCDGAPASPGHGVNMVALHGKMKQSQREQALEKFATGSGGCLLCTDVAARGLDIPGVDWVVQFDAPQDPAAFVHRVGRTARMGREGSALLFLSRHESSYVEFLRVRHIHLKEIDGRDEELDDATEAEEADAAVDEKEAGLKALREELAGAGEENEDEDGEEEEEEESEEEESEEEEEPDEADADAAEAEEGGAQLCGELRARSEKNREAMEKGVRAFVSYLRGYKEHHCRFIFRFKELELARLAKSLGLLRLPRMKEIRKAPKSSLKGFTESTVNPDTVPFLDKAREKQRLRGLAEEAARRAANPEAAADSRKEREKRKREEAAAVAAKAQNEKRLTASKRRQMEAQDDFDDLDDDYRALKKWKKGKISEEEFDLELGFEQPDGLSKRDRELAQEVQAAKKNGQPAHGALQGAALKASMKKPRDNKPRHLKASKAKGGGRSKKKVKKAFKKSGGVK
jgi:ATP-dependent RNA helicase DDX55/SPB4